MALTVATNTGALMAQAAASSVNKEYGNFNGASVDR